MARARIVVDPPAVEFDKATLKADPGIVDRAVVTARGHGILTRNLRGRALQSSPPT